MSSFKDKKPIHYSKSPALQFSVYHESKESTSQARRGQLILPHGPIDTPVFMPVGTQAAIKGLLPCEMSDLSCQIILANTYHLGLRPGTKIIDKLGGIHKFINWSNNLLTDSGGFQMVSLLELAEINEKGVKFQSPMDGTEMLLTPEKSIELQNEIGSDIIMALDDVVPSTSQNNKRFEEACYRTIRWLDRCIKAHKKPLKQNLFGIIQGGLSQKLREYCLNEMIKRDKYLPGYAIGGLVGGESKDDFWKIVYYCTTKLPKNKPKYVMGVGYPLDLVICVALGADMFDCVYPCRTARFGTALIDEGELQLKYNKWKYDYSMIDNNCNCKTCKNGNGYSKSYLFSLIHSKKETNQSSILITHHNIYYLCNLMKRMRISIENGKFDEFVKNYMVKMFPNKNYPKWTIDALKVVGINLN